MRKLHGINTARINLTANYQIHVLKIPSHTDPADIEVVDNTGYGVGTPGRTTAGGIELVYSDKAADHSSQNEKNYEDEQSSIYDYVIS